MAPNNGTSNDPIPTNKKNSVFVSWVFVLLFVASGESFYNIMVQWFIMLWWLVASSHDRCEVQCSGIVACEVDDDMIKRTKRTKF